MRVLVCGGRDFTDVKFVHDTLDKLNKQYSFTSLIHGGARGVDRMAGGWAVGHRVHTVIFAADWKRLGKVAGIVRNQDMLDFGGPDIVIAFHGGTGTDDMKKRTRRAGIILVEVEYNLHSENTIMEEKG